VFRFIETEWDAKGAEGFGVGITIRAVDSNNLLVKLATVISQLKLGVESINARKSKQDETTVKLIVTVRDMSEVGTLIAKLEKVDEVVKVYRT